MSISVKVESNKDDVLSEVARKLDKALEIIGLTAEAYAKTNCPVDTGNLRNSITHRTGENYVAIGTNVEYAPYVEMGTSSMKARPYLQPAIENHLTQYEDIIKNNLK